MFSAFGIPLKEGEKSPLVGMLQVEKTDPPTEEYIEELRQAFGDVHTGPTIRGSSSIY
jgi:hypothetical protein